MEVECVPHLATGFTNANRSFILHRLMWERFHANAVGPTIRKATASDEAFRDQVPSLTLPRPITQVTTRRLIHYPKVAVIKQCNFDFSPRRRGYANSTPGTHLWNEILCADKGCTSATPPFLLRYVELAVSAFSKHTHVAITSVVFYSSPKYLSKRSNLTFFKKNSRFL